jgi:hypothetical protein
MGGCACERPHAKPVAIRNSLQNALNSFWPPSSPYPPRAPWLAPLLGGRDRAVALVTPDAGQSGAISGVRKSDAESGAGEPVLFEFDRSCADCPERTCFISYVLPRMAADWYAEGGWARDLVVLLYEQLGQEFCASGECEDSFPEMTNCRYECLNIYLALYHASDGRWYQGYVYEFWCCCDERDVDGPGPGPGPWDPFPWDIPDFLDPNPDPGQN